MFFVYVLCSTHRSYIYVGLSSNLERRLYDHNQGNNPTTKPYKPFNTILIEEYPSRQLAREREQYLKSGVGKEYLKQIIRNSEE